MLNGTGSSRIEPWLTPLFLFYSVEIMTTSAPSLDARSSLMFSHMGFCVRDLPRMARFYKEILGFTETDSGDLCAVQLVFLSRDPTEHHQDRPRRGVPPHSPTLPLSPVQSTLFEQSSTPRRSRHARPDPDPPRPAVDRPGQTTGRHHRVE